jgi:hypothetical protein
MVLTGAIWHHYSLRLVQCWARLYGPFTALSCFLGFEGEKYSLESRSQLGFVLQLSGTVEDPAAAHRLFEPYQERD